MDKEKVFGVVGDVVGKGLQDIEGSNWSYVRNEAT